MKRTILLPVLLGASCTVQEDTYGDTFAARYCATFKGCDEDAFFDTHLEGTPGCRTDMADDIDDGRYGNGNSACTWRPEVAQACLDDLWVATCDELLETNWVSTCTQAWDCVAIIDPGAPR